MAEQEPDVVKYLKGEKCFGFITRDGCEKDVIVYFITINTESFRRLDEDQRVYYEVVEGNKGQPAQNI
jgi:cold shock protein